MGQCVIIGCRPTWDLETFVPALEEMAARESAILLRFSDQLQLSDVDREWTLIVHPVSDQRATLAEYESDPELDEQFRAEAHDLRFFVVRYNDIDRMRRLIRSAAQRAVSLGESAWI